MDIPAKIELSRKTNKLRQIFHSMPGVVVAFSGGVDSSVAAAIAHDTLYERAIAAIAVSPSLQKQHLKIAREVSAFIEIPLLEISTDEVDNPDYQANNARRCYFCKHTIYEKLAQIASKRGWRIVDGFNLDDLGDVRPGMEAARENQVEHPLLLAKFTKADVRALGKKLKLPNWNNPAQSCTSSRVFPGVAITSRLLWRIEQTEEKLRAFLPELATADLRVRHLADTVARLEVSEQVLGAVEAHWPKISTILADSGYHRASFRPYLRGSLNQLNQK